MESAKREGIYTIPEEPARVEVRFQPDRPRIGRLLIHWHGRWLEVERHYYHQTRRGDALQHHLHVTADGAFFELRFDANRLQWFVTKHLDPAA